ncbi:metallophosphoesterase [Candidatus Kirkpatrickella diaphorinae]|uniref:Metallophosphoesterase n=1 Tax=Candidatus Kirkpatrickella diaphorinae TaxID=2984322 RepID=A0ABY6GKD9_9PROT|nr:metallophosphoesterase [Candidatus Kirkpatrickella diaphorinae]UYH52001.1 metallophosphoesterase [Candidatus Kirkpatrickella diaphorinae]
MCKYLPVILTVCTLSGCAGASSTSGTHTHPQVKNKSSAVGSFDDRSTSVQIIDWLNVPVTDIKLVSQGVYEGEWKASPPSDIQFDSEGHMVTTSNAWLHGAGGWATYKVKNDGANLSFAWYNPYNGSNSYWVSSDPDDYYFTQEGTGGGNNASITWYVRKKTRPQPIKNYRAIIMADAQPWRLSSGGDPNSESENGAPWRKIDSNTFNAIKEHSNVKFMINNGDLTEYGRTTQYNDYARIYHATNIPLLEGLGNHDYANNVHDCYAIEDWGPSSDGCALNMVIREYNHIQYMKNNIDQIPGAAFSADVSRSEYTDSEIGFDEYGGSFSYSWDVGDVHYVQLQNHPLYTINLEADTVFLQTSVDITNSLAWLRRDLERADLRGKVTIINFHDARPFYNDGDSHFLNKGNLQDLATFKSIITSHKVKAIFVGHTHVQAYCRAQNDTAFGNIPVYTAGALFKGDYYLIDVKGQEISVSAFNGKTGMPDLVRDLGVIGSDTDFSSTCSNL